MPIAAGFAWEDLIKGREKTKTLNREGARVREDGKKTKLGMENEEIASGMIHTVLSPRLSI